MYLKLNLLEILMTTHMLQIKTPQGVDHSVPIASLTLDSTFAEVEELVNLTHTPDVPHDIIFICTGRTIPLTSTFNGEELSFDNVFIIVKKKRPEPEINPEPAEAEQPAESGPNVTVRYTGEQVLIAIKSNPDVLFSVIHLIAQANPFFLSYLAINPVMAREHVEKMLTEPDFKFTIKGDPANDPIKPTLMHPCGKNGYQIDQDNLKYILDQTDIPVSEPALEHAKSMYLLHDRDIRKTISILSDPTQAITAPLEADETPPTPPTPTTV